MKKTIITILVLVVLVALGYYAFTQYGTKTVETPESTQVFVIEESPVETGKVILEGKDGAVYQKLVNEFYISFAKSSEDTTAASTAKGLLTEEGQTYVDTAPSISAGLAMFVGVQDIPDVGMDVKQVSQDGDMVSVETVWKYSGGEVAKTFIVIQVDGEYKIFRVIQQSETTAE